MATTSREISGTAPVQGELWSARARDWAAVQEPLTEPLNESVLRKLEIGSCMSILDVGCGPAGSPRPRRTAERP